MDHRVKTLLAAGLVALAGAVSQPAAAGAALVDLTNLPNPSKAWPFKTCDRTQHRFIIDAAATDMCGGDGRLGGPGWAFRPWPGLVQGGQHYLSFYDAGTTPDSTSKSEFFPTIAVQGLYDVWVSWRATHNRASRAPYYVFADDGNTYRGVVDQRGDEGFRAVKLGRFFFLVHRKDKSLVTLVNSEGTHSKGSDGVFIRYVGPTDVERVRASKGTHPDKIVVRWDRVLGVRAYRVFRSATTSLADATLVATIDPPEEVFTDPLPPGSEFNYWVRAVGALNRTSQHISNRATGSTAP